MTQTTTRGFVPARRIWRLSQIFTSLVFIYWIGPFACIAIPISIIGGLPALYAARLWARYIASHIHDNLLSFVLSLMVLPAIAFSNAAVVTILFPEDLMSCIIMATIPAWATFFSTLLCNHSFLQKHPF